MKKPAKATASPEGVKRPGAHLQRLEPQTLQELRAWLAAHHGQAESVWVVYRKKDAGGAFALADIVDEALCFGWIDSLPRKLDEARTMILVSQRKSGSGWSKVNKDKVARLAEQGRLAAPGLAKIEAAKADGSWDRLTEVDALNEPEDLLQALRADPNTERFWRAFPPSARRGILEWIGSAKTDATRQKRIAETVALAAQNKRANQGPKGG